MLKNFKDVIEKAKSGNNATVVVPIAEDEASLSAVIEAKKLGFINSILIGKKDKMNELAKHISGEDLSGHEIIEMSDHDEAAKKACMLCREKKADIILKGSLPTASLLKAVLNAETGLRTERLLSDVFIYEDTVMKKLVGITDGGITPLPDLDQKRQLIENAVTVFHKLGVEKPKVAMLSAVEKVSPKLQSTVDASELAKMNKEGKIEGCIVEGPLALDNAVSKWCAEMKGLKSEVAEDVDIFVMPNIEAGNIFAKSMVFYSKAKLGHVIMGAKAPVLINSRVDDAHSKLHSIALAIIACL